MQYDLSRMTAAERITMQFYQWELRGRGWLSWSYPVVLEPPFEPFAGYQSHTIPASQNNDGRYSTFFSRIADSLKPKNPSHTLPSGIQDNALTRQETNEEWYQHPAPDESYAGDIYELTLAVPPGTEVKPEIVERFLSSLINCKQPVSFEIRSFRGRIVFQFAVCRVDVGMLKQSLAAYFPEIVVQEEDGDSLFDILEVQGNAFSVIEFGLSEEFFLPIAVSKSFSLDPLLNIVTSLAGIGRGDAACFQILFSPLRSKWRESIQRLVSLPNGESALVDMPDAPKFVQEKLSSPLFAVAIRAIGMSKDEEKAQSMTAGIARFLSGTSASQINRLVPLSNGIEDMEKLRDCVSFRATFRSGMILNSSELAHLVHPPSASITVPNLLRTVGKTKQPPPIALRHGCILGENLHQGKNQSVSLSNEQRTRHLHLIGASGSGKSTLMLSLIKQDLEQGQGLCVIEPHGDLIDEIVANVPEERINDVVLFDPSDAEYPIGFNILQAHTELEKTLLSSDLVATFRRMATSWGDVMDSVLANAILAFTGSTRGGTLFDLRRFLTEKEFRYEFLGTVEDESIRYFWLNEFPQIQGRPQSSILVRLDSFMRNSMIRNIVCQKETKLNFREIMDRKKILLVKLSQGLIGEENAQLLGTLFVSKLYQTAISRQDSKERPYFWLYMDEFQHFITPSMESILSGVRKYKLGLHLAHQEFRQLQSRSQEVAYSVLSNCYTRICFRLGDTDAERFATGFSFFDGKDLQNLGIGEAIGRIERAEFDFNLKTTQLPKVEAEIAEQRKAGIIRQTRQRFAKSRADVVADLFDGLQKPESQAEPTQKQKPQTEKEKVKDIPQKETQKPPVQSPNTEPVSDTQTITESANQQHRYLQTIVKRVGESMGFVATLEKQVFGGIGKIDVALENESRRIAVEIAFTNTIEYELQNIQKCLVSGFDTVVVVSSNTKHLLQIKSKAESLISAKELGKVFFLEPENIHLFLESQSRDTSKKETKIKGYTVSLEQKPVSDAEHAAKQAVIDNILRDAERRSKK